MFASDFSILLPEIILAIYAMIGLMVAVYTSKDGMAPLLVWTTVAVFVFVAAMIGLSGGDGTHEAFGGMFIDDGFSRFAKVVILLSAAAILAVGQEFMARDGLVRFEYPMLITLAAVGMMVMVSAGDLMTLYMGLELQSLSLYVVASLRRDSVRSTEAGLKYFVLGALSSGLLLYGASLTYGFAGTTLFSGIFEAAEGGASLGLVFGLVFMLAGLAFKVSAAPFHMWTPDVYEGAPTPVTAFFAAAPKIAAMAMFTRIAISAFEPVTAEWQQITVFMAIASMVLGAFAAIGQTNIKRLLAYSSIGHMGFALVGLSAGSLSGVQGVVVYLSVYLAMTLGVFACVLAMRRKDGMVEEINELSGLSQTNPVMAVILACLLFSLAGIPVFGGFFAKFYVFTAAIEAELYALAIIGVLASVVGAYYYLRIVKIMYFDEPAGGFEPMPRELRFVLGISGIFVIPFVFFAGPVISAAEAAAKSIF